jgi:CRISPR system Cascade subunit CasE
VKLDVTKRSTQVALISPNKIHGAVESSFKNKQTRNLWRIDTLNGAYYLLILSADIPDLSEIIQQFGYRNEKGETKDYNSLINRIEKDSLWRFRLVANPTYSSFEEGKRGKIVAHVSSKHQLEWLFNKAGQNGFSIKEDSAKVLKSEWKIFKKKNHSARIRIKETTFEGILKVEDVELMKKALLSGIGREKAYGMGMLTIVKCED